MHIRKFVEMLILFDEADWPAICQHEWYLRGNRRKVANWYAYTVFVDAASGKKYRVALHDFLMGAKEGHFVDHINGNGLDNRRENLRWATHTQNLGNTRPNFKGTSRFKGVAWVSARRKWRAQIHDKGNDHHLGMFQSEEAAARAYDKAAIRFRGEFAWLNFPEEGRKQAIEQDAE